MNETQIAYAIARELDAGVRELPQGITDRLSKARANALDAYSSSAKAKHYPRPAAHKSISAPTLFQRFAIAGVPALTVVFGLVMIGQWSEDKRIEQLAELDAAVLLDDLPIAAYADKGFGVYLKNTRQWAGLSTSELAAASAPGDGRR